MKSFSKIEAIKFGWNILKKRFWFFILIGLISIFIQGVPNFIGSAVSQSQNSSMGILTTIIAIVGFILKLIIDLGIVKVSLKLHDQKDAQLSDLFSTAKLILKYLGGMILYGFIVLGGLILLIGPGIYLGIRFQYYNYFIVDEGVGPMDALKKSWKVTQGQVWNLFLLGLLLGLLNILGVLLLLIGLLFTIPTTLMAQAYVFRKLQSSK